MKIKKITTSLVLAGFIFAGCSNSQNTNVVHQTPSVKTQETSINLRFEKAVSLQNQKNFSEAIEIYNSIIRKYSDSEYKNTVKSAYINMFECSVLSDRTFRLTDVSDFLERYGREKESLMKFELLHILNQAKHQDVDEKVEKWASRYSGQRLRNWTFSYIDYWVAHIESPRARNRLKRYVHIFKKFI